MCGVDGVHVEVELELLVGLALVYAHELADVVGVHLEQVRAQIGGAREAVRAYEAAEGLEAGMLLLVAILRRHIQEPHAARRTRVLFDCRLLLLLKLLLLLLLLLLVLNRRVFVLLGHVLVELRGGRQLNAALVAHTAARGATDALPLFGRWCSPGAAVVVVVVVVVIERSGSAFGCLGGGLAPRCGGALFGSIRLGRVRVRGCCRCFAARRCR